MNPVELLMRRRNVAEFIKADPVEIVISRNQGSTKTPAGGYIPSPHQELAKQQARIVLNKRRYNPGIINSEAGDIPETDYLLVARHTFNIEEDDTFVWMGNNYVVIGIHKNRTESVLASINMVGPENRNG